jgi:hypothetical protein
MVRAHSRALGFEVTEKQGLAEGNVAYLGRADGQAISRSVIAPRVRPRLQPHGRPEAGAECHRRYRHIRPSPEDVVKNQDDELQVKLQVCQCFHNGSSSTIGPGGLRSLIRGERTGSPRDG